MRGTAPCLILLLFLPVPPARSGEEGRPSSPAEEYRALLEEYHDASTEFRKAGTDEARKAAVEHLERFPPRFLALAERNPKDALAVDASVEVVRAINAVDSLIQTSWDMNATAFPAGGQDDSAGRTTALLLRDHARSDKLGPVCERMSYGIRKEFESFLREVQRSNPHRDVQALACLALARLLNIRVQKLDLVEDRPELAGRYEGLLGKDTFEEWHRQGRTRIAGEIEALFERAAAEYGALKFPYGGTIGDQAKEELFEIRHLAAGREAPDIEGEDQDGRRFKLSDYRGKVVLLDFWQEL